MEREIKAIKVLERYKSETENEELKEALEAAVRALNVCKSVPIGYSIEEIVARNIIAWETSKDKKEGLLPEVYLTDQMNWWKR